MTRRTKTRTTLTTTKILCKEADFFHTKDVNIKKNNDKDNDEEDGDNDYDYVITVTRMIILKSKNTSNTNTDDDSSRGSNSGYCNNIYHIWNTPCTYYNTS